MLVDMTTIEAITFGRQGLEGMKVVEYAPPVTQQQQQKPVQLQNGTRITCVCLLCL